MTITLLEITAAGLFALAVLHTFSTRYFEHLAHTRTAHAGIWHLLGEVEAVFGFWAIVLVLFIALAYGWGTSSEYLDGLQFTEPMFVFVIMVIAASRPVMQLARDGARLVAGALPARAGTAYYFVSLALVPLLGSRGLLPVDRFDMRFVFHDLVSFGMRRFRTLDSENLPSTLAPVAMAVPIVLESCKSLKEQRLLGRQNFRSSSPRIVRGIALSRMRDEKIPV